ncbi:hypothetical protein [Marinobacterium aestuariivivens]|uniref:Uncharacterized protein n=1 Tax=Marinobacterium aestuariivivens TaxID=1698799 RepID=A0ABW2A0P8_9GAMM
MNYRAPLLLILLILVPLLLLGWLGVRLQQNERQLLGLQLQKLVEQQLETVDGQLQGHFQQLERLLQQQARRLHRLADRDYPADRLRAFLKDSAQVRQLFVLDDRDERLFPPRQQPLSADEQRLVEQLQPLWQSPDLFRPAGADPLALDTSAGGDRDYLASGQLARQAPAELADAFRTESEPAAAPAAEGGRRQPRVGSPGMPMPA